MKDLCVIDFIHSPLPRRASVSLVECPFYAGKRRRFAAGAELLARLLQHGPHRAAHPRARAELEDLSGPAR
jgi:hypothetical protein